MPAGRHAARSSSSRSTTCCTCCCVFYKEDDDTTVIADGFPLLNALRETHLLLAEGAHNQFGDLPSTARAEMLMHAVAAGPAGDARLPRRPGHGPLRGGLDGPGRHDEDSCRAGPTSASRTSATSASSASRSCCRSATATGSSSTTRSRRRTGPATGGRRSSATSTPTGPRPAWTSPRIDATMPARLLRARLNGSRQPVYRRRCGAVADFTSSLYLGMTHPSARLDGWRA